MSTIFLANILFMNPLAFVSCTEGFVTMTGGEEKNTRACFRSGLTSTRVIEINFNSGLWTSLIKISPRQCFNVLENLSTRCDISNILFMNFEGPDRVM